MDRKKKRPVRIDLDSAAGALIIAWKDGRQSRHSLVDLRQNCPCATCRDRPCMSTCPVEAHSGKGLDLLTCVRHMDGPDGEDCIQRGCQARRACPVSPEFLYRPEQANFHMDSFTRLRKANFIARGLW